ncbi:MAG TPA: ABC transporter ATP-binding protein, partial [Opitutaceae bacterium]|nr:ABC transporter ATP-binding protein [Opitutaceae bacterium]
LLARLFTKPANVLVMDEPTNDLDAETLDLLEDLLVEYQGTLLVVSHDRDFLDNVVASTFVFEGDGHIGEYVGGYTDWLKEKEKEAARAAAAALAKTAAMEKPAAASPAAGKPKKLSNKEQKELAELPAQIEAIEAEQEKLGRKLGDPAFYQKESIATVSAVKERLDALEAQHAAAFARWEDLESRKGLT